MPMLEVRLVRKAPDGEIRLRIGVQSVKRPEITTYGYCDPDAVKLEALVEAIAGTVAEHQCVLYGDDHNPAQIAHAAVKLLERLKKKADRANHRILGEY